MRHETFWKQVTKKKKKDKRTMHRPRWDRRVIKSLGDEEGVDPNERRVEVSQ